MNKEETRNKIHINIKDKNKIIYTGFANNITSINERGIFDILPLHTNYITLIKEYIIINKGTKKQQKFDISEGVLYILSNKVDVYVGI